MKKILFLLLILGILSISAVSAQIMCNVADMETVAKKALFNYLPAPQVSKLNPVQIRELVQFYLNVSNLIEARCDMKPVASNVSVETIVKQIHNKTLNMTIPFCSDGTHYGKCSATAPKYCFAGQLVDRCRHCGCPSGYECNYPLETTAPSEQWGKCVPLKCIDGTLYNQCSATKPLFCSNGTLINSCSKCGCASGQICLNNTCTAKTCNNSLGPDLTVTDIVFSPSAPFAGQLVARTSMVKNLGTVASPVVNIKGYVDDVLVAYGSFGPLQPGATVADYSQNVQWGGAWNATSGMHKFEFVIDADNHADECNETNNRFVKYLFVNNATTTEMPPSIVIKGRMINGVTGEPYYVNLKLTQAGANVAEVDSNGNFTINVNDFSGSYVFFFSAPCTFTGGIGITWDSAKKRLFGVTQYLEACQFQPFSYTREIDIGTFKVWPAASIKVNAAMPFTFMVHTLPTICQTNGGTYGNVLYKTEHQLTNVLPVDHRTEIALTFENGTTASMTSDTIRPDQKCQVIPFSYPFSVPNLTCSDGTANNACSSTKPLFCANGTLIHNCNSCGCSAYRTCIGNGSCMSTICVDGTQQGQCSATKPLYCNNGILNNQCSSCGCPSGSSCYAADEICITSSNITSSNILSDNTSKKNLTFSSNGDQIVYFKVLKTAKIIYAYLNIMGLPTFIDQSNMGTPELRCGRILDYSGEGPRIAQSFIPTQPILDKISIYLDRFTNV